MIGTVFSALSFTKIDFLKDVNFGDIQLYVFVDHRKVAGVKLIFKMDNKYLDGPLVATRLTL